MFCIHCGQVLPEEASFCFSCGKAASKKSEYVAREQLQRVDMSQEQSGRGQSQTGKLPSLEKMSEAAWEGEKNRTFPPAAEIFFFYYMVLLGVITSIYLWGEKVSGRSDIPRHILAGELMGGALATWCFAAMIATVVTKLTRRDPTTFRWTFALATALFFYLIFLGTHSTT